MGLQRYYLSFNYKYGALDIEEDDDGEWVKSDEAEARIKKLEEMLARAKEVEISHLEVMKDVYYLIDSGNNIQAQEVILKTLNNFKKKKRRE